MRFVELSRYKWSLCLKPIFDTIFLYKTSIDTAKATEI